MTTGVTFDEEVLFSWPKLTDLPTLYLDRCLLVPFGTKFTATSMNTPALVPLCFAAAMSVLRLKSDVELQNDLKSFLETDKFNKGIVKKLTRRVFESTSIEEVTTLLSEASCRTVFKVIIQMLGIVAPKIFAVSARTIAAARKLESIKQKRPYPHEIFDIIFEEAQKFCQETSQGNVYSSRRKSHKETPATVDQINMSISQFYDCSAMSSQQEMHLINRFNACIFHDLHCIPDPLRRNLTRFMLRNMIYLVRRYTDVHLKFLQKARKESWPLMLHTTRPHVEEYAYRRIAEPVAPVLMGMLQQEPAAQSKFGSFHFSSENQEFELTDSFVSVLKMTFAYVSDAMWYVGQTPQKILTFNLAPTICHSNCPCNYGQAVDEKQRSYSDFHGQGVCL